MTDFHACECGHAAHFDKHARTPNGKSGHKYGQKFHRNILTLNVAVEVGPLNLCLDCQEDCHADYISKLYHSAG